MVEMAGEGVAAEAWSFSFASVRDVGLRGGWQQGADRRWQRHGCGRLQRWRRGGRVGGGTG